VAEQGLGHGPAVVERTHQIFRRHFYIAEKHLAEFFFPGDMADGADIYARQCQIDQQKADALLLLVVVAGAYQRIAVCGFHRQGGPDLLAVDDKVVALAVGAGFETGEVGTGVGLGIALGPVVIAGEDARQVLLLLGSAAVFHQGRAELGDTVVDHPRYADALHLFVVNALLAK